MTRPTLASFLDAGGHFACTDFGIGVDAATMALALVSRLEGAGTSTSSRLAYGTHLIVVRDPAAFGDALAAAGLLEEGSREAGSGWRGRFHDVSATFRPGPGNSQIRIHDVAFADGRASREAAARFGAIGARLGLRDFGHGSREPGGIPADAIRGGAAGRGLFDALLEDLAADETDFWIRRGTPSRIIVTMKGTDGRFPTTHVSTRQGGPPPVDRGWRSPGVRTLRHAVALFDVRGRTVRELGPGASATMRAVGAVRDAARRGRIAGFLEATCAPDDMVAAWRTQARRADTP